MVNGIQQKGTRGISVLLIALACVSPAFVGAAQPDSFGLLDSGEMGALNIGESQSIVEPIADSELGRDVLNLEYSMPGARIRCVC